MKEKASERVVIEGLLSMIQYMSQALNLEAANVLHQTGWCKELIADNGCPVCKIEKERENNANIKEEE
jgi:hypothetical protein